MKLLSVKNELKVEKAVPGLVECMFDHKIREASAEVKYLGPTISKEAWDEMLAFFQWTYDTTKSESQVRWYVNLKTREWQAWAYPQEARTGMTAKELDTPEKKKQREMFNPDDGWFYFGTAHHHCACGAFQSGTDANDEKDKDGLHITVGNMNSGRYDLHARFYLSGFCFEPDLSKFWDIGDDVRRMLPPSTWDAVARYQMTEKVDARTEFPVLWKENLIEVKTTFPITSTGQDWTPGDSYYNRGSFDSYTVPLFVRARRAVGELTCAMLDDPTCTADEKEIESLVHAMAKGDGDWEWVSRIAEVCCKYKVTPMEMWSEIPANGELDACIACYESQFSHPEPKKRRKHKQISGTTQDTKALGNDGMMEY